MILIADSGSTKTTWAKLSSQDAVSMKDTVGLNPHVATKQEIASTLTSIREEWGDSFSDIYFYGAGCGTEAFQQIIAEQLNFVFPHSSIVVDSDLKGACIASLGEEEGMVGILGTGSNVCYYNGDRGMKRLPSLGYVLGDEGSGNHIGRLLIKSYFENTMPADLRSYMQQQFDMEYVVVIDNIYSKPHPNAYFASFAPFAREHNSHPFIKELVQESFAQYFRHQVLPLGNSPMHMVGSVAYHFKEDLLEVAESMGIVVKFPILKSPIEGLVMYFTSIIRKY